MLTSGSLGNYFVFARNGTMRITACRWMGLFLLMAGFAGCHPHAGSAPEEVQSERSADTPKGKSMPSKLISRSTLFGNPDKAAARLSPDGTKLSYLAPVDDV